MITKEKVSCYEYICQECGYDWISKNKMKAPKCPVCAYLSKEEKIEKIDKMDTIENLKDKFMGDKEIIYSSSIKPLF